MDGRNNSSGKRQVAVGRLIGLLAIVLVAGGLYWQFGQYLNLQVLAEREAELKRFQANHPVLVYGAAFLIYAMVTGLSIPGAAILTLATGWYFGFWPGAILVSFASSAGATLAFLLCRYFLRDAIEGRFSRRLATFNNALESEGPFYLFTLRLIPVVPFFVINAVMGLTRMRTWTFWWVSQIGMLPGTAVYVYAGSRVPTLQTLASEGLDAVFTASQLWQFTLAFALLGLFPLAARYTVRVVKRYRDPTFRNSSQPTEANENEKSAVKSGE